MTDMYIQISPWRWDDATKTAIVAVEKQMVSTRYADVSDGIGVYLCCQTTIHIQDFIPVAADNTGRELGWHKAMCAAFAFADGLAETTGWPIITDVERPELPDAVTSETDLMEAACCLWEAAIETTLRRPALPSELPEANDAPESLLCWRVCHALDTGQIEGGQAGYRLLCCNWADECHRAWFESPEKFNGESYDWDFVPRWLQDKMTAYLDGKN